MPPRWRSEPITVEGLEADLERVDHERIETGLPRDARGRLATGKDGELVLALYECAEELGRRVAALVWTRSEWGLRSILLRNHPQRWDLAEWRWKRGVPEPHQEPGSWDEVQLSDAIRSLLELDPRPLTGFSQWSAQGALEAAVPWSRALRWQLDRMDPGRLQAAWDFENAWRNTHERKKPLAQESLRIMGLPGQTSASRASLVLRSGPALDVEWTSVNDRLAESLYLRSESPPRPPPKPRLSSRARQLMKLLEHPDHQEQGLELASIQPELGEEILSRGQVVSLPGLGGGVADCGLSMTLSARLGRRLPGWRERLQHVVLEDAEDLAELEGALGALVTGSTPECSTPIGLRWLDGDFRAGDVAFLAQLQGLRWLRLELRETTGVLRVSLPQVEWLSLGAHHVTQVHFDCPRLRTLNLQGRRLEKVTWPENLERFRLRANTKLPVPDVEQSSGTAAPLWSQRLGFHG